MKFTLIALAFLIGLFVAMMTLFTLLGLGLHRQGASWAIAGSATLWVFGPPLVVTGLKKRHRLTLFGLSACLWNALLFSTLPVYFPGERNAALATGLTTIGLHVAEQSLPPEPALSTPRAPEALISEAIVLPAPRQLADHQIALPYEGEGRQLTVELAIQHGNKLLELNMMLDTGATYTTLPRLVLATMGVSLQPDNPTITLQTANGERQAELVLIDKLWLGDLAIEGVAIAVCDECANAQTTGLLGLNVTGGYNLNIDADRREVVFSTRKTFNRHLDVKPFVDIEASISRFKGGQVEVDAAVTNNGRLPIKTATVSILCGKNEWLVSFQDLEPGLRHETQRRLPRHDPCDAYEFGLQAAAWGVD